MWYPFHSVSPVCKTARMGTSARSSESSEARRFSTLLRHTADLIDLAAAAGDYRQVREYLLLLAVEIRRKKQ